GQQGQVDVVVFKLLEAAAPADPVGNGIPGEPDLPRARDFKDVGVFRCVVPQRSDGTQRGAWAALQVVPELIAAGLIELDLDLGGPVLAAVLHLGLEVEFEGGDRIGPDEGTLVGYIFVPEDLQDQWLGLFEVSQRALPPDFGGQGFTQVARGARDV